MSTSLIVLVSLCFTLSQVACFDSTSWIPLNSASKKIVFIKSDNFDTVLNRCYNMYGHLLYVYDNEEAGRVADEIARLADKAAYGDNFWIGVKKYPTYSHAWRWTAGGPFYADRFNMSATANVGSLNDYCGLMQIFKSHRGYNYTISFEPCHLHHSAICQASINAYEAVTITAMTVGGIAFIGLLILVVLVLRHRRNSNRQYMPTSQEVKDGVPE